MKDAKKPARSGRGKTQTTARRSAQADRTDKTPAAATSRQSQGGGPGRAERTAPRRASGNAAGARPTPTRTPARKIRNVAAPNLQTPPASASFRDRDGETHSFPDSGLKRLTAWLLTEHKKLWRYRPFGFPLFTQAGREQTFTPDFVVYDHQDAVLRVLVVAPRDTPEIWDRLGRFKRQYPTYPYELWTPEKLEQLSRPRARLGF